GKRCPRPRTGARGQTWGETLGEPCYDRRVHTGRAAAPLRHCPQHYGCRVETTMASEPVTLTPSPNTVRFGGAHDMVSTTLANDSRPPQVQRLQRVAIYARVSTEEQKKNESIKTQLQALDHWVAM